MEAHTTDGTTSKNGDLQEESKPLEVIIVGAGIAGLSLGIFLRQNGHRVRIFEQSKFARELGAAVHIPPNAHGLVKRMGIDPASTGANEVEHLAEYNASGEVVRNIDFRKPSRIWQHKWMMAHRVRLHEALKERALATDYPGLPCELHLATHVDDVDAELGRVTLQDGGSVSGDVIIGADGLHSRARRGVPGGEKAKPFSSGKSAFRFLLKRKDALEDPTTRHLCETPSTFTIVIGTDRRIIMYPTSNNELLNVVCIHPEEESEGGDDWSTDANKESLLRVYQKFDPAMLALLAKAEPTSLKVWKLMDMENLPTWVNGRLVLIGDAAHPFLPHQGQGGAVAMEDAAALGVVLERGLSKEEVPERLKLYERIRYERANIIQEFTRQTGKDIPDQKLDTITYRMYNFGHDEIDNATQKLREWKYTRIPNPAWMMPVAFGPAVGCTTVPKSRSRATFATATVKFVTSRTLIRNLLPQGVKSFEFANPGTVAVCSLVHTTLKGGPWLSSREHGTLSLFVHNIKYTKADGSTINGTYVPVMFDNIADAVMRDRETLGLPKVFTEIHGEHSAEQYDVQAESQDVTWASITLRNLQQSTPSQPAATLPDGSAKSDGDTTYIAWRTMPIIAHEGTAEQTMQSEAFAVSTTIEGDEDMAVESEWTTTDVTIDFNPWDWQKLPTLHEAARRLSEIPIYRVLEAKVQSGAGHPNFTHSKRLE